ncbi:hypothetical protein V6N12_058731 [Hibiscus sabdariffa]|uniref:Uncharacterized protein n=1 Tax=Hibiscus sabdariffa TaxID=183260 RepID=A0ABR2EVR3_9ROSI
MTCASQQSPDTEDCLSELVHSFLEDDRDAAAAKQTAYYSESDRVHSNLDSTESLESIIKLTSLNSTDSYRNLLLAHVSNAIQMFSFFRTDKAIFRRQVMAYLCQVGHNAEIYKTKWISSGGLTAGSYEFIDVVQSVSPIRQNRYFVDLDLASEFEIARPMSDNSRLLHTTKEN